MRQYVSVVIRFDLYQYLDIGQSGFFRETLDFHNIVNFLAVKGLSAMFHNVVKYQDKTKQAWYY